MPPAKTLGWPWPVAEEGEVTPNLLQTPGSETEHPAAHAGYHGRLQQQLLGHAQRQG